MDTQKELKYSSGIETNTAQGNEMNATTETNMVYQWGTTKTEIGYQWKVSKIGYQVATVQLKCGVAKTRAIAVRMAKEWKMYLMRTNA